jgi:hypothetical protein
MAGSVKSSSKLGKEKFGEPADDAVLSNSSVGSAGAEIVSLFRDDLDIERLIGRSSPTLASLATQSRWVEWREEKRDGKVAKVPYHPKGYRASSTSPAHWSTRDKLKAGKNGFVLGDGYGGLDLDDIRDPATGQLEPEAAEVIRRFETYTEVSPSGKGVKLFFQYRPEDRAALSDERKRIGFNCGEHREMAVDFEGRYYTVTEQRLDGTPIELRMVDAATLNWFVREAGPAFKAGAPEKRDRSDEAWAIANNVRRKGGSFDQYAAEITADPVLAEWAKDKRQLQRAWDRAAATLLVEQFEDLGEPDLGAHRAFGLIVKTPADCAASPRRGYVVKRLLAPSDVGCIYGAPGAGKSLIAPHIGYMVALGELAFGLRTKQGKVLYVAPEDPDGLSGRVEALLAQHGDTPDFHLVSKVTDLLEEGSVDLADVRTLVAELKPALIFIDTLAMGFPGLEENSAEDMGRVVHKARSLTEHGAAVCLIHHDTKAGTPTPRGHSILNGALDFALQLVRDEEGIIRGKLSKNRNGPCDLDIAFRIATVDRGEDEDGDPVKLPYVAELTGAAPKREKLSPAQRGALAVLSDLRAVSLTVSEAEWRAACLDGRKVSGSDVADNRRRTVDRTIGELARLELIVVRDGKVFLPAELERSPFDDIGSRDTAEYRTRPDSSVLIRSDDSSAFPDGLGHTPSGVSGCPEPTWAIPTQQPSHN